MKSLQPAVLFAIIYIFCPVTVFSKKSPTIENIKVQIKLNQALSDQFLKITKNYGSPMWGQAIEQNFDGAKVVATPITNYNTNYTSGIIYFLENKDRTIEQKFVSREEFKSRFVKKKKNHSQIYFEALIYSFLNLDLKTYNFIDLELSKIVIEKDSNREAIISNFRLNKSIMAFFK